MPLFTVIEGNRDVYGIRVARTKDQNHRLHEKSHQMPKNGQYRRTKSTDKHMDTSEYRKRQSYVAALRKQEVWPHQGFGFCVYIQYYTYILILYLHTTYATNLVHGRS